MSLYYEDDYVTLYHGDCLTEHLEWLEADVLVTDPPYGISYKSDMKGYSAEKRGLGRRVSTAPIKNDESPSCRDDAITLWEAKPALIFGRWEVTRPHNTRARLIWSKAPNPGMGDLSLPWGRSDEEIYVLGGGFRGPRTANILTFPTIAPSSVTRPDHPTPKPVPLMEHLIEKCPPGVVADPFAGSGSTLVAAKLLGRKAIGVELEERYCEIAARRLSQEVLDLGSVS